MTSEALTLYQPLPTSSQYITVITIRVNVSIQFLGEGLPSVETLCDGSPHLPSARMRERVTVVTLSVCLSVTFKAQISGLKLTSVYILGFKSFKF